MHSSNDSCTEKVIDVTGITSPRAGDRLSFNGCRNFCDASQRGSALQISLGAFFASIREPFSLDLMRMTDLRPLEWCESSS